MNKRQGFTLIELLAVIVILAIILAIAIPTITGIVNNAKKQAFEDDAKLLLRAVNYKILEDEHYDVTQVKKTAMEDTIESELKIGSANYVAVSVTMQDNKPYAKIVGTNKFEGLTAEGNITNITVHDTVDKTAPVITLLGDTEVTINLGDTYTDAGSTALDETDGDITANIVKVSTVNPAIGGTYTVTYNVSDAVGNAAITITRTVIVVDPSIPIYTQADLAQIATGNTYTINSKNYVMAASEKYKLMNDIALSGSWTPLGLTNTFTGTFNGNNYTISGLSPAEATTTTYKGLFGKSSGTIKNLNVGGTITGSTSTQTTTYIGMLVAYNSGTVDNCVASGSVGDTSASVTTKYVGGLIGYNDTGSVVTNSHSSANVSVTNSTRYIGGLIGHVTSGTITNSYVTGTVTAPSQTTYGITVIGGLLGETTGTTNITSCYVTNSITATSAYASSSSANIYAGGIAGNTSDTNIDKCYVTGSVSANYTYASNNTPVYSGGLVGIYTNGTIKNSFATGNTSAQSYRTTYAGGLIAYAGNANIYNSYATGYAYAISTSSVSGTLRAVAYAGGLVGSYAGTGILENTYAIGNVSTDGYTLNDTYTGGLVGQFTSGTLNANFWNTNASLSDTYNTVSVGYEGTGGTSTYLVGLTSDQIKGTSLPSFTGYGGTTYTDMLTALNAYAGSTYNNWGRNSSINSGYPYLTGVTPAS